MWNVILLQKLIQFEKLKRSNKVNIFSYYICSNIWLALLYNTLSFE